MRKRLYVTTASHNPAECNGYKVYGQDGCQITTEAAREIQRAIDAVDVFDGARWLPWDEGAARGLIVAADDRIRRRYIDAVIGELEGIDCSALSVAYTPLNGTGLKPVRTVLARMGVGRVEVVLEQAAPDGECPTCPKPNPEVPEAMRLVTELAAGEGCDLARQLVQSARSIRLMSNGGVLCRPSTPRTSGRATEGKTIIGTNIVSRRSRTISCAL